MKTEAKNTIDSAKKVGDDVIKMGRNVWLAGLGMVAYADEEARSLYGKLVDKGETFEKSEKNIVGRKLSDVGGTAKKIRSRVSYTPSCIAPGSRPATRSRP